MSRLSDRLNELNSDDLSLRDIAERAARRGKSISFTTVGAYLKGDHPEPPSPRALKALAAAFEVPVEDLETAATFTGREPFIPDPASDRLTPPQRAVLNDLIRVMADSNEKAGDGDGKATPLTQAGVSPEEELAANFIAHKKRLRADPAPDDPEFESFLKQQAAKRGPNRGKQIKRQQDDDAE